MDPAIEDEDFHATFHQLHYDDSSWESGQDGADGFGYGDKVGVSIGEPEKGKRYTAYFRHRFSTTEPMQSLVLTMQRDDGVIVYLDGEEILRDHMPEDPEAYDLLAKDVVSGTGETYLQTFRLEHALDPGEHVLAISLHNQSPASTDLRIAEIGLHGLPKEGEPAK